MADTLDGILRKQIRVHDQWRWLRRAKEMIKTNNGGRYANFLLSPCAESSVVTPEEEQADADFREIIDTLSREMSEHYHNEFCKGESKGYVRLIADIESAIMDRDYSGDADWIADKAQMSIREAMVAA